MDRRTAAPVSPRSSRSPTTRVRLRRRDQPSSRRRTSLPVERRAHAMRRGAIRRRPTPRQDERDSTNQASHGPAFLTDTNIEPSRQPQVRSDTSNERNRQSIPGGPPHTPTVSAADNTRCGMATLLTALSSPALPHTRAISKSSYAKQIAPKPKVPPDSTARYYARYARALLESSGLQLGRLRCR